MQGQCFYDFGTSLGYYVSTSMFLEKSFGKVNPLPSADFMRVGLFPFFHFFGESGVFHMFKKPKYKTPNQTIYEANSGEIESNREIWGTFSATSVQEKLT